MFGFGKKKKEKKDKPLVKGNNALILTKEGVTFGSLSKQNAIGVTPMRCRNNGKDYLVVQKEDTTVKQFEIPDSCQFYDPGEYGNVLAMPAHKKLFERREGLLKQLAPYSILIAMAIFTFLWVVTTG